MSDLPPLFGYRCDEDGNPVGVWWRLRDLTLDLVFNDRYSPPGPGFQWADAAMAAGPPPRTDILPPPDPPHQPEPAEHVLQTVWNVDTGRWESDPTAGLAQLDDDELLEGAAVPEVLDRHLYDPDEWDEVQTEQQADRGHSHDPRLCPQCTALDIRARTEASQ